MRLAGRMDSIGTETAFEAAARARALEATGRDVIHLEIGEPDFDTPRNVSEAAVRALLEESATHYTAAAGIEPLREAIAEDAAARKGFPVDPAQVFVTVGGKGVMVYAILGLIDPGDEVIVPDPGYPIYASLTSFVGARNSVSALFSHPAIRGSSGFASLANSASAAERMPRSVSSSARCAGVATSITGGGSSGEIVPFSTPLLKNANNW